MGRIAPDLAVQDAVVPRSALPDIMDRIEEIRGRHGLSISNVFHAGDGNLHPNISFDRRDPELADRVQRGLPRDHGRLRRGGRQHHRRARRGLRQDRLHAAASSTRETLGGHARRAARLRSRRARESRARSCRCTPAANGARRRRARTARVSDVVFGRLRALLGTGGVERDAGGLPRATPDTADALSLVCRLAHDEGWKIRVEGHGTWLAADAPADLAVSTRGARPGAVGQSRRPGRHGAGRHAARGAAPAARRRGDVARARSARAGPSAVSARSSRPAPRARCATASARCATTCSAAPSRPATAAWCGRAGGWSRTSPGTISPSSRSAASAASASSPRSTSGSAPCRAPTSP